MDTVNHLELSAHPSQVRSVLRAVLCAIFFQRTLDIVEPQTFELLDCHITNAPSSAIERDINAKIDEFVREFVEDGKISGEIAVVFLQKRPKKGWFAITEELIPWEEHLITLHFDRTCSSRSTSTSTSKQQAPTGSHNSDLNKALFQLITFCAEKKGNVPSLADAESLSHQILIAPPSPTDLFSPSPPTYPQRLTSPPPAPITNTTPATATALPSTLSRTSTGTSNVPVSNYTSNQEMMIGDRGSTKRGTSPAAGTTLGYLEQAKDGLRAVGAKAGAGVGWGGRAMGAAFGRGGG
ncbi:hypothetical protein I317_06580 [Kwoniella heveanensis CBS 569]|nr:hypothetical protein I317_06580 [Kwoniella heveanensis CBS 569]